METELFKTTVHKKSSDVLPNQANYQRQTLKFFKSSNKFLFDIQ